MLHEILNALKEGGTPETEEELHRRIIKGTEALMHSAGSQEKALFFFGAIRVMYMAAGVSFLMNIISAHRDDDCDDDCPWHKDPMGTAQEMLTAVLKDTMLSLKVNLEANGIYLEKTQNEKTFEEICKEMGIDPTHH